MHKIRNFYNNIVDPMSKEGDVTMDTHAIAAGLLKPLSGNSKQVGHNFGTGSASSNAKGIKGTYFAFADAYTKAAADLNILPRELQSITWEAVRGLFTDTYKANKNNIRNIEEIYKQYENNNLTKNELRKQIIEAAGGINNPTWSGLILPESTKDIQEASDTTRVSRDGRDIKRTKLRSRTKRDSERFILSKQKGVDRPNIKDVIKYGRENKIPKQTVVKALKELGFTEAEINKAYGKIPKTKAQIKEDLRNIAKGEKIGIKKYRQAQKELIKYIKDLNKRGNITNAQSKAMLRRVANTNMINPVAVDRLLDYLERVYNNAAYVDAITRINKILKNANKNVRRKIGTGEDGLMVELYKLFNIDPTLIPENVFNTYIELVTSFGERATVLTLKESEDVKTDIAKIFEELNKQSDLVSELTERFDAFEKVMKDGRVDFNATIKKMEDAEVITKQEADLMRKFKSQINPKEKVEPTEAERQEALDKKEEERQELLKVLKDFRNFIDVKRINFKRKGRC